MKSVGGVTELLVCSAQLGSVGGGEDLNSSVKVGVDPLDDPGLYRGDREVGRDPRGNEKGVRGCSEAFFRFVIEPQPIALSHHDGANGDREDDGDGDMRP